MTVTLALYIARRFLVITLAAAFAVLALVVIVDLVELMRANSAGRASFATLIGMALLHAPSITITAAPFTVLLAAMTAYASLARSSELVVTRAAGVSVWALLAPALITAVVLGVLSFTVYSPIAAAFATKFDALEQRYFDRKSSSLSVSASGLWLRQGDATGQTVIRAQRASGAVDRLWEVSVFQFDAADRFSRRIEARRAVLEPGLWRLNLVRIWDLSSTTAADGQAETQAQLMDEMTLSTDLTTARIQDSFSPPETISFWALPGFIAVLDQSGFSSNRHLMHYYKLLAAPVVFAAMVLIGAAFSMRHLRFGGLGLMALGCVMSGFGYFFLSDIAGALGASGAVPVVIAAWAPPISAVLFALGLLLHLEDG